MLKPLSGETRDPQISVDDLNFEERIADHDDEEDLDILGRQVSLFIDTNTNYDDDEFEENTSNMPTIGKEDHSEARKFIETSNKIAEKREKEAYSIVNNSSSSTVPQNAFEPTSFRNQ